MTVLESELRRELREVELGRLAVGQDLGVAPEGHEPTRDARVVVAADITRSAAREDEELRVVDGLLLFGLASARRERPLVVQVEGRLREDAVALVVVAQVAAEVRCDGATEQEQLVAVFRTVLLVHVEDACQPVHAAGFAREHELLAQLLVVALVRQDVLRRRGVGEVEQEALVEIAPAGDRLDRDAAELEGATQRDSGLVGLGELVAQPADHREEVAVGVACEVGAGEAGAFLVGVFDSQREVDIVVRLEAQLRAGAIALGRPDLFFGGEVLDVALVLTEHEAVEAQRERVADRRVDHRPTGVGVIVAISQIDIALELVFGLAGDHLHGAAGGVAAVQGALRAAQDLDAVHVVEEGVVVDLAGDVDAVDIGADRRIGGGQRLVLTDAAQEERGGAAETDVVAADEVRDLGDHIERVVDLLTVDVFGAEGGDRDRHILQRGGRALRRDGDLCQHEIVTRVLRHGGGGGGSAEGGGDGDAYSTGQDWVHARPQTVKKGQGYL